MLEVCFGYTHNIFIANITPNYQIISAVSHINFMHIYYNIYFSTTNIWTFHKIGRNIYALLKWHRNNARSIRYCVANSRFRPLFYARSTYQSEASFAVMEYFNFRFSRFCMNWHAEKVHILYSYARDNENFAKTPANIIALFNECKLLLPLCYLIS